MIVRDSVWRENQCVKAVSLCLSQISVSERWKYRTVITKQQDNVHKVIHSVPDTQWGANKFRTISV